MDTHHESAATVAAKAALPAGVSLATIFGIPVSDAILWLTLIYTVLLILHKCMGIYKDFKKL